MASGAAPGAGARSAKLAGLRARFLHRGSGGAARQSAACGDAALVPHADAAQEAQQRRQLAPGPRPATVEDTVKSELESLGAPCVSPTRLRLIVEYLRAFHLAALEAAFRAGFAKSKENDTRLVYFKVFLELDVCALADFECGRDLGVAADLASARAFRETRSEFVAAISIIYHEHITEHGGQQRIPRECIHLYLALASLPETGDKPLAMIIKAQRAVTLVGRVETLYAPALALEQQVFVCENPACGDPNTIHLEHAHSGSRSDKVVTIEAATRRSSLTTNLLGLSVGVTLDEIDLSCNNCGEEMTESLTDLFRAQILPITACSSRSKYQGSLVSRRILILLKDYFVNFAQVGDYVVLTGIMRDWTSPMNNCASVSFEVSHAQVLADLPATVKLSNKFKFLGECKVMPRPVGKLPDSILQIGRASKSPLTFTQHILDAICDSILPPLYLRKLKLLCLLSLVSIAPQAVSPEDSDILDLIVLGGADPCVDRLLRYMASLKSFALWNRVDDQSLVKAGVGSIKSEQFISRTPLTDAKRGVLYMPFLHSFKPKEIKELEYVMKETALYPIPHEPSLKVPRDMAFWAVLEVDPKFRATATLVERMSVVDTLSISLKLLVRKFDLVTLIEPTKSISEADKGMAGHLLAEPPTSTDGISFEELSAYIHTASKISVEFSDDCADTLQSYFMCCRKVLAQRDPHILAMIKPLTILRKIAKAQARLALKSVATVEDAVQSIMVFEEILAVSSGVSLLGFQPLRNDELNMFALYAAEHRAAADVMKVNEANDDAKSDGSDDGGIALLRELGLVPEAPPPAAPSAMVATRALGLEERDRYYHAVYMSFYEHLERTIRQMV